MEKYLTKKSVFIAGIVIAVLLVAWMMVFVNDSTTVTESEAKEETVAETKQSENTVSVKDKQDEPGSSSSSSSSASVTAENAEASLEPSEVSVSLPENEIVKPVVVAFEGTVPVPPTTVEEANQGVEENDSQPVIETEEPSESGSEDAPTDELNDEGSTHLTVIGVTVE